jgi:MFS transporter, ACS family, tartrate transporter
VATVVGAGPAASVKADPATVQGKAVVRRVIWRLMPFLALLYFMAQLDRVNVSFAALTMNADLGLSATVYGWGASVFFISYVALEVPSNLVLERVGARIWIARIMFTWGLLAAGMAFITGPWSYYAVRLLLGAAEAGFYPGVILYLTYWFPRSYRARVLAVLSLATPLSTAAGAVLAAPLLSMHGVHGLAGWQWLFLIEGLPSVVLGFATLKVLTDRPDDARWLGPAERRWLSAELAAERRQAGEDEHVSFVASLRDARVLLLTAVWLCRATCLYGVAFFLPQVVRTIGGSTTTTALLSAVPFVAGAIGMLALAYSSDRMQERRWHVFATFVMMAVGLGCSALLGASPWTILALSIATIGNTAMVPCFWPIPPLFLTGAAAAGGIAFINAVGNIGGVIGPYVVGAIKDSTDSFAGGLYALGGVAALGAILTIFVQTAPTR